MLTNLENEFKAMRQHLSRSTGQRCRHAQADIMAMAEKAKQDLIGPQSRIEYADGTTWIVDGRPHYISPWEWEEIEPFLMFWDVEGEDR